MIERWLQEHLERCGRWNSDRVSRKASSARCRGCGRMLLVGLDADRCALVAAVDAAPLSAQGEMVAKLLDLRTYSLRWAIDYLEINQRTQWHIRHSPAPSADGPNPRRAYDVVAQHACDVQALPGVASVHTRNQVDLSGPPPF